MQATLNWPRNSPQFRTALQAPNAWTCEHSRCSPLRQSITPRYCVSRQFDKSANKALVPTRPSSSLPELFTVIICRLASRSGLFTAADCLDRNSSTRARRANPTSASRPLFGRQRVCFDVSRNCCFERDWHASSGEVELGSEWHGEHRIPAYRTYCCKTYY